MICLQGTMGGGRRSRTKHKRILKVLPASTSDIYGQTSLATIMTGKGGGRKVFELLGTIIVFAHATTYSVRGSPLKFRSPIKSASKHLLRDFGRWNENGDKARKKKRKDKAEKNYTDEKAK